MDKKIGFLAVMSLLIVLFIFFLNPVQKESFITAIIRGDSKEKNLDNYIMNVREKQTIRQRQEIITLYIQMLDRGNKNSGRTQSPAEAPEVCELARQVTRSGSEIDKAKEILEYLSNEIEYDWGNIIIDTTGKPRIRSHKPPSEVIAQKKALCGEFANTLMLMGECLNLPIYFVYGGGHAWNILYSDEIIELDATTGCFNCSREEENRYPIMGLCDRIKCISMSKITKMLPNIYKQTIG